MADKTADELRADLASARANYLRELAQAAPHWERRPGGSPDGEDAWSARQVAEHIAGTAGFFANGIAKGVGLDGAATSRPELPTCDDALAATPAALDRLDAVTASISDEQLRTEFELAPLGTTTVRYLVELAASHIENHTGQLSALKVG